MKTAPIGKKTGPTYQKPRIGDIVRVYDENEKEI